MNYEAAIDLHKQMAFITALLGGFSITFLVGLLQAEFLKNKRLLNVCLILVTVSCCSLILSTIASISGAFWLTERPHLGGANIMSAITNPEINYAFDWSAISLVIGLVSLLMSIGLYGRFHSKKIGRVTLILAVLTIVLIFFFWMFLVKVN